MTRIENLERILNADDLNDSIIELDDFICKLGDYADDLDSLSEHQKAFYLNQNLEREVNNGGFKLFFINSSGGSAYETILSLQAIAAHTTAEILQQAINQFPVKKVPKDKELRWVTESKYCQQSPKQKKLPEELVENRGFDLLLTCGHDLTAVAGKTRHGIVPDDSIIPGGLRLQCTGTNNCQTIAVWIRKCL